MKRLVLFLVCLTFLLTGCGMINPAGSNSGIDTQKEQISDNVEEPAVSDDETAEEPKQEEETPPAEEPKEAPKNVESLDDDADKKPDADEKKLEEEKAKEAEKKPMPYKLQIDVTNQVVTAFGRDSKGNYTKVVRRMIASTGTSATPTPLGTFTMPGQKGRWGYFTKFDVYAQYWSRIRGGILFHSVLYKTTDESTLSVSSYNNLGKPASHGCIRLQVADAKWIYNNAPGGTEVVVMKGKKNAALTASLKPKPLGPQAASIAVSAADPFALEVGKTQEMAIKVTYDNKSTKVIKTGIKWTVDNAAVATIKDGVLKAVAPGKAVVTAEYEKLTAKVTVTVNEAPKAEPKIVKFEIAPAAATIKVGEEKALGAKVTFDNGKEEYVSAKAEWSIDGASKGKATISAGKLTPSAAGEVKVIAKYAGLTANATVTITEAPKPEEPKPEEPKPEEPKAPANQGGTEN